MHFFDVRIEHGGVMDVFAFAGEAFRRPCCEAGSARGDQVNHTYILNRSVFWANYKGESEVQTGVRTGMTMVWDADLQIRRNTRESTVI